MPFEQSFSSRKSIAVIGAGISGMGAAHYLADHHDVTLIEAEPRLGGHARTVMAGRAGDKAVDTGFIVFNYANYPHLTALFEHLDVPVAKSDMSFGASVRGGALEFGLSSLDAVFAQRKNALDPRFLGMIRDVMRFNARAVDAARDRRQSIGEFIEKMGLGDWFRDYYLLPLSGSIWSTPVEQIMDFPAHAMIQFFENHALLHHTGQHQWWTVEGGSREYVRRLEADLRKRGVTIRLGAPVEAVTRDGLSAEVRLNGAEPLRFDEVIFATHSDDTLRLLADADADERRVLGAVRYQPNDIVLHADEAVMPKRRKVWSSWNYAEGPAQRDGQIDLTYWMNRLQPIPKDDPLFVTLNSRRTIREELIYDQVTLRHPVYDLAALDAQAEARLMQGRRNTWFCGAWMANGFHEDGLKSAFDVAEAIRARKPELQEAAE